MDVNVNDILIWYGGSHDSPSRNWRKPYRFLITGFLPSRRVASAKYLSKDESPPWAQIAGYKAEFQEEVLRAALESGEMEIEGAKGPDNTGGLEFYGQRDND